MTAHPIYMIQDVPRVHPSKGTPGKAVNLTNTTNITF